MKTFRLILLSAVLFSVAFPSRAVGLSAIPSHGADFPEIPAFADDDPSAAPTHTYADDLSPAMVDADADGLSPATADADSDDLSPATADADSDDLAQQTAAQVVTAAQPEEYVEKAKTLYLRAGAGYSLHPVVDFIYTPRFNSKTFGMSVYGTHRSYFGKYREISAQGGGTGIGGTGTGDGTGGTSGGNGSTSGTGTSGTGTGGINAGNAGSPTTLGWNDNDKYSGHDSYSTAGILGRTDWDTGFFTFDVSYIGYANKDASLHRNFDMGQAKLRIASRKEEWKYFFYDISAAYLFGTDYVRSNENVQNTIPYSDGRSHLQEQDFSFATSLGPVFSPYSKLLFDINFDLSRYNSYFDSYSGRFSIAPKYLFRRNRWFLNLGLKISIPLHDDSTGWASDAVTQNYSPVKMHKRNGQTFYPDVEIGFDLVRNYLNLYIKATGGTELNRYSSMVAQNHFLSLNYAWNYAGMELMNTTVENVNARFGLQGNIASRFSYNLYGGYARYHSLPLDAVLDLSGHDSPDNLSWESSGLASAVAYAKCNVYYATLDLGWHSTDLTIDGYLSYMKTNLNKSEVAGFEPARVKGGFNITYNWRKRIYIGLTGEGVSSRRGRFAVMTNIADDGSADGSSSGAGLGADDGSSAGAGSGSDNGSTAPATYKLTAGGKCRLPGWFDLGISAEYRFNNVFSFWLYGSNLLGYTIQTAPLHAASGPAITAGITINL